MSAIAGIPAKIKQSAARHQIRVIIIVQRRPGLSSVWTVMVLFLATLWIGGLAYSALNLGLSGLASFVVSGIVEFALFLVALRLVFKRRKII